MTSKMAKKKKSFAGIGGSCKSVKLAWLQLCHFKQWWCVIGNCGCLFAISHAMCCQDECGQRLQVTAWSWGTSLGRTTTKRGIERGASKDLESANQGDRVDLQDYKRLIWATTFPGISGLGVLLVRSVPALLPHQRLPHYPVVVSGYIITTLRGGENISLAPVTGLRRTGIYQTSAILIFFFLAQDSNKINKKTITFLIWT